MNLNKSFDYHIHIGQFYEEYFEPHKVIENLNSFGLKGCWFSSTTSCMAWSNGSEKTFLKEHIKKEVNEALETAKKLNFDAKALYWVNLDEYLQEISKIGASLNIKNEIAKYFETCINNVNYYGIKIHTRFNYWDLSNEYVRMVFDIVCDYVKGKNMPILIHCGPDECDSPKRFDEWFGKYQNVKFVLAHMRPVDDTIYELKKYNNVYTDTAFAPEESIDKVYNEGFGDRVLFGTDYPLNKDYYGGDKIL